MTTKNKANNPEREARLRAIGKVLELLTMEQEMEISDLGKEMEIGIRNGAFNLNKFSWAQNEATREFEIRKAETFERIYQELTAKYGEISRLAYSGAFYMNGLTTDAHLLQKIIQTKSLIRG